MFQAVYILRLCMVEPSLGKKDLVQRAEGILGRLLTEILMKELKFSV